MIGSIVVVILGIWLLIYVWPADERPERAFYREDDPEVLNIAHRGGAALAPEGTLTAFDNALAVGADVLEYDTHITSDGHLVVIHDATVDRTTNGTGTINEMTLEEVQSLDAGYTYTDEEGNQPYRDSGVYIPSVAEVFEAYPNTRHLIEMKDTNDSDLYEAVIQELWRLIQEHEMEDNIMVGSFLHDINERFEEVSNGEIPIGGGEEEVREFVTKHAPYLNGLSETSFDNLQIPTEAEGFDLTTINIIESAEDRNMAVYYWTINEEDTICELIEKGADGLMTDDPELLQEVIEDYKAEEE